MKILSWNIAGRKKPWQFLLNTDIDIALLQEAGKPPLDVSSKISIDDEPWQTFGIDGKLYCSQKTGQTLS